VQTLISQYGYLAIFLLMVAESACIPLPSEVTMPFGGALAAGAVAGTHLSLILVVAAGVAGNLAGSYVAWGVGRYGGPPAARRLGRYVLLRHDDLDRAERWFKRHGGKAVFFGRLLPVIRTFISLPAGFAQMPALRFGLYTVAGCIPWTLGLAWAGYAVGANWRSIQRQFAVPTYAIAGLVIVGAVVGLVIFVRKRRREEPGHASPSEAHEAPESVPAGDGRDRH